MSRDLAAQVASLGLTEGEQPLSLPSDGSGSALSVLGTERLTGLAVHALLDGTLELTEELTDELLDRHQLAMCRTLDHERALFAVDEAFAGRGITYVVLKGSTFAHAFYPDPSWRPFADLDLLVPDDHWGGACAVLEQLGYTRSQPEPRAGFDVRFGKAAEYVDRAGVMVDLHRTLVLGPFGLWIDPDELLAGRVPQVIGGQRVQRLDDTGSLLHACLHAALGWWPPTLMSLRDIAQITQHGEIGWSRFLRWTDEWRLHAVVVEAFRAMEGTLGIAPPDALHRLLARPPPKYEQRLLACYQGTARHRGGPALAALAAIPGVRAKLAYLGALLVPDRRFLAARSGDGDATYRRRWAVALRWLSRRR